MDQYKGPIGVWFPIWVYAIFFGIIALSWGYYIFLEIKAGYSPKRYINIIFIFLAVFAVIVIFLQPIHISEDVICRMVNEENTAIYPGIVAGDVVTVEFDYDMYHYTYFAMYVIAVLAFIYIGLFIFPKRFTGITFLKYMTFAFYIYTVAVLIGGYIMDFDKYIPFLQSLTSGDKNAVIEYAIKGFMIHRNVYAMMLLIAIVFTTINHAIDGKWWYYPIIAFLYINMLFSWSTSSILIATLLIGIYVLYRLIVTFKDHKKRNSIILISVGSVAIIALGLGAVAYLSKGQYLTPIYSILNSILGGGTTLSFRTYIWDNIFQLLRNGWWIIGRGFGMYNVVLGPMNVVNGDIVFASHSGHMNVLANGGIVFLFAYLAFYIYYAVIFIRCFKKNPGLSIALSFGVLAFTIYSFVETIEYVTYLFAFPMMIFYYSLYPERKKETSLN